jgi:hypothetical protein
MALGSRREGAGPPAITGAGPGQDGAGARASQPGRQEAGGATSSTS